MGIGREKLEPVNACLRGFSGERVLPLGLVQLVLTLGDTPCQATTMLRFLIVDALSIYNMLLGRPSLNAMRVVPSAYHMVIKFPTANGVGMVRGNQRIAREYYSASMKQNCDASFPGGPLTTRQPAEYSWMSGNLTPLTKIGQSHPYTGSSTQGTKSVPIINNDHTGSMCE